jgi:hypothetical protein
LSHQFLAWSPYEPVSLHEHARVCTSLHEVLSLHELLVSLRVCQNVPRCLHESMSLHEPARVCTSLHGVLSMVCQNESVCLHET